MTSIYEPPVSYAIAIALGAFGIWAGARGARMMSDGLAGASALTLIRGIRCAIVSLVAGFFAVGVVSGRTGFITFGAIILAEELYETGVLALFVRLGEPGGAPEADHGPAAPSDAARGAPLDPPGRDQRHEARRPLADAREIGEEIAEFAHDDLTRCRAA